MRTLPAGFIAPCLPTKTDRLPSGDQWLLGSYAGALPLSAINLRGRAVTPQPSIVVNFRSFTTGCDEPTLCTAIVADTRYQQGQGIHGSLSRAETLNFMAAIGPDFRRGFVDSAPVSNADVGMPWPISSVCRSRARAISWAG